MYPQPYIDFLVHFHADRDYFECHEILEEYWKEVDEKNKQSILVGFILLAVANYHHRRNNFSGAKRTLTKALHIFTRHQEQLPAFGYVPHEFIHFLNDCLTGIEMGKPYKSIHLPLHNEQLLTFCIRRAEQKGLPWGQDSDLTNEDLIHRHIRRDRRMIVLERELELKKRQRKDRK